MIQVQTRELLGLDSQTHPTSIRYGKPRIRNFKSQKALGLWSEAFTTTGNGDWLANWERFEIKELNAITALEEEVKALKEQLRAFAADTCCVVEMHR